MDLYGLLPNIIRQRDREASSKVSFSDATETFFQKVFYGFEQEAGITSQQIHDITTLLSAQQCPAAYLSLLGRYLGSTGLSTWSEARKRLFYQDLIHLYKTSGQQLSWKALFTLMGRYLSVNILSQSPGAWSNSYIVNGNPAIPIFPEPAFGNERPTPVRDTYYVTPWVVPDMPPPHTTGTEYTLLYTYTDVQDLTGYTDATVFVSGSAYSPFFPYTRDVVLSAAPFSFSHVVRFYDASLALLFEHETDPTLLSTDAEFISFFKADNSWKSFSIGTLPSLGSVKAVSVSLKILSGAVYSVAGGTSLLLYLDGITFNAPTQITELWKDEVYEDFDYSASQDYYYQYQSARVDLGTVLSTAEKKLLDNFRPIHVLIREQGSLDALSDQVTGTVADSRTLGSGLSITEELIGVTDGCSVGCEVTCELTCEGGTCEGPLEIDIVCKLGCEVSCVSTCEVGCETGCEVTCESGCQITCETGCTTGCTTSCEVDCEALCETSNQSGCVTGCEVVCEGSCQATCQAGHEVAYNGVLTFTDDMGAAIPVTLVAGKMGAYTGTLLSTIYSTGALATLNVVDGLVTSPLDVVISVLISDTGAIAILRIHADGYLYQLV